MTQNELFEIALTTDPAQIGHHVQGGYMTGIYPISDEIKAIGPAFTQTPMKLKPFVRHLPNVFQERTMQCFTMR